MSKPVGKQVIAINAEATTNGATATGVIDTLGFDYVELDVALTTSDSTTNNPSVFKISQADANSATNYADITALVGDGSGGWTIPAADTANAQGFKFGIDKRGLKRYLKLTVSPTTTQSITAIANLYRARQTPISATKANVAALVQV